MWTGDLRNPINAVEGVDLLLGGFNSGMAAASRVINEHHRAQMYDRAVAAKAAADRRYAELCRAWHVLADHHERALDRIDQLERLLAQR